LSAIAFTATTIERNVVSSSTNASDRTKANTSGARDRMRSLKSFDPAVWPATSASAPSTAPTAAGRISPRSRSSAAFDRASVPLPAIGRSRGRSSMPEFAVFIPSAGIASATSSAVAPAAASFGWPRTRSSTTFHARDPPGLNAIPPRPS
jgi:hypothetical protein